MPDPFFTPPAQGWSHLPRPLLSPSSTPPASPPLSRPPTPQPHLPPELLDQILSQITHRPSLTRLCLASRTLCPLAQRYLYRSLYFGPPKKTAQICRSILARPSLGAHVLSIEFALYHDLPSMASDNAFRTVLYPPYTRLVFRAFRLMHRLNFLRFCGQDGRLRIFANLDQCPFELETLLLLTVGPCDPQFLLHQPRVQQLKIAALMSDEFVTQASLAFSAAGAAQSVFPSLRELTTSWAVALKLVPHRPVERLAVIDFVTNAALREGLPAIGLSSSPGSLRYLELTVLEVSLDLLQLLAHSLPGVTTLVIRERKSGTVALSLLCAHTPSLHLPSFRSLVTLKLFKLLLPEKLTFPDRGWNAMVQKLGQASSGLRYVALGVVSQGDGGEPYGTLYYERRRVKPLAASAGGGYQSQGYQAGYGVGSRGAGSGEGEEGRWGGVGGGGKGKEREREREVQDIWDIKVRPEYV